MEVVERDGDLWRWSERCKQWNWSRWRRRVECEGIDENVEGEKVVVVVVVVGGE